MNLSQLKCKRKQLGIELRKVEIGSSSDVWAFGKITDKNVRSLLEYFGEKLVGVLYEKH